MFLRCSPCCLPSPLPRQDQVEAFVVRPLPWLRPSLQDGGSAPATPVFGACSVFTHVTACKLAESPERPFVTKGFDDFVSSIATSAASGWNDRVAGWVSHPWVNPNPCTAHILLGELETGSKVTGAGVDGQKPRVHYGFLAIFPRK